MATTVRKKTSRRKKIKRKIKRKVRRGGRAIKRGYSKLSAGYAKASQDPLAAAAAKTIGGQLAIPLISQYGHTKLHYGMQQRRGKKRKKH